MEYKISVVHFDLTANCNLKCKYCYYYEDKEIPLFTTDSIPFEHIEKAISEIEALSASSTIPISPTYSFSGGEIFLRKDLYKILDLVSHRDIILRTNGMILNQKHIDKLHSYNNIVEFIVSYDGVQGNKLNRGMSNSDKLWSIIYKLTEQGKLPVSISTTVTKHNVNELISLYEQIKKLPFFHLWTIDLPFLKGRVNNTLDDLLIDKRSLLEEVKNLIITYKKESMPFRLEVTNVFVPELIQPNVNQPMRVADPSIGPITIRGNGDITYLPAVTNTFGNISANTIGEIIKSKNFQEFVENTTSEMGARCKSCEYLFLCGLNCPTEEAFLFHWPCIQERKKWLKESNLPETTNVVSYHELSKLYNDAGLKVNTSRIATETR